MGPSVKPSLEIKPDRFRFFISYASEDYNIATAVYTAILKAAGPAAGVFMDVALQFGANFHEEIRRRLDQTNVLVVVHSGILKPEFSFTGLELGYFDRLMGDGASPDFPRLIVPIYLEKPPDAIAAHEGINIGISRATLNLTLEGYKATLGNIDWNHSGVRLLQQFQELINKFRERHGLPQIPQNEAQQDLPAIVAKMQVDIFSHLKTTQDPEGTLKPQYQITLKTNDDALRAAGDAQLPSDTQLIPEGTGTPMSIFGLPPAEITWEEFQKQTKNNKFRDSWIDAITKVVRISLTNQLAKDNSQVIVSYDGWSAYRVILTTGIRDFNGNRTFNIYFVNTLQPRFGDPKTTSLFEGLELSCRFRSLFLEAESPYSIVVCRLKKPEALKEFVSNMERELNLLLRDALEVGLDDPAKWAELLDPNLLVSLSKAWRPLDSRIREAIKQTRISEAGNIESCRESLMAALTEIDTTMRPLNVEIIGQMADRLKKESHSIN